MKAKVTAMAKSQLKLNLDENNPVHAFVVAWQSWANDCNAPPVRQRALLRDFYQKARPLLNQQAISIIESETPDEHFHEMLCKLAIYLAKKLLHDKQ